MDEDARVMAIYLNCSAMEPPEGLAFKDLGNELHWNEQKRFNEWAGQRGVLRRIPSDAETGKAALLELVGEEEGRLEDLLATHPGASGVVRGRAGVRRQRGGGAAATVPGDVRPVTAASTGDAAEAP